uniref:MADS-box domain-containing protein n=1 Tax=Oryza punctata TaxID=4537 RepID=A0A0E0JHA8_ORYPU
MARKKIVLDRIANDATRRATFKKRRRGLVKKASELATLCDVDACLVVYGEGDAEPEVWPSMEVAMSVLRQFRALPEMEQCKKMMNQEDFLRQRIGKLKDQVSKMDRENHERETVMLLHDALQGRLGTYETLSVEQLTSLDCLASARLKAVADRLVEIRDHSQVIVPPPPLPPAPLPAPPAMLPPPPSPHVTPAMPLSSMPPAMGPPPGFEGMNHHHHLNQNHFINNDQNAWLMNVARNGGDLGALVYSAFAGSSNTGGAGTSGAAPAGPDMMDLANPDMPGFGWPWDDDSAGPSFPPM